MTIFSIFLITNIYIDQIRCQLDPLESEDALIEWLRTTYEDITSGLCNKQMLASWDYNTDIDNADKQAELAKVTVEVAETRKQYWNDYFSQMEVDEYESEELKRQLKSLKNLGTAALDSEQLTELTTIQSTMSNTYSTAKICPYTNQVCDAEDELSLEPGIEAVMSSSTDYDELEYTWVAWRDASGAKIREYYGDYVDLSNTAAKANGYNDMGAMWKDRYETDNFENSLDLLWEQVKPLYDELHTYVRRKLQVLYGEKADMSDGLIPAHILGNMWAQSWVNIAKHVKPFPDASEVDVTGAMVAQDYTPRRMFEESNQFYMEMGLEDNYMSYGSDAMIEKPADREVLCHASAWDFCDGEDFRIKMCTNVDMEDFITVHHEMGHIQYYLQYKDQPYSFRGGANPGFHEAVGDTIALSVATPKHLQKIGLLPDYVDNEESSINALMDMALERVAFLPFGYLIDKWRWDVFSGDVEESEWNSHWWYYRNTLQKVKAPVDRTEDDFDPGAKYHVPGNSQYINYFVAHILEFQLYRGLCREAGEYDPEDPDLPLHKCDFDQNTAAGAKLSAGLSLGSSVHWSEALEAMTGETELDATALLEYFQPLYEYLKESNERALQEFFDGEYAEAAERIYNAQVTAEWNFAVDVTNEQREAEQIQATLETAAFEKSYWTSIFQHLQPNNFNDVSLQRQVKILKVLGNAALEPEKLEDLTESITAMTTAYSTAKICPYGNEECDPAEEGLSLDPDIESIISTSTDYDELLYVWRAWRDASGATMKDSFRTYVELSNEAAKANGFEDKGEMWRNDFESDTFIDDVDKLWTDVEPLYKELHTFVLNKLKTRYSDQIDEEETLIPAHVLGNMWAQTWNNIADLVKPYPDASEVDITAALIAKGYNVLQMFDVANEFYTSLGLENSAMSYDVERGAMIEKPDEREVLCHASAWDFYDGEDFRIKMCTTVNYNDFVTIHHELGHIQYFLLYKDQPITLRTGANPGFHEAVGDTIALSVATPQHFETIGLLDEYEDNEEASINALMDMALERVAFLPFGLLIDKWRWDVFSGDVEEDEWNDRWWHYRETLQKVKAPVERTADDFDPGAKFHVAADYQYISYFIAHIVEFQFFKALCIEAGQYDPETKDPPLHKCDFYKSAAAGQLLRNGLELGASQHWSEVLERITGETDISASALLEYFDPLYEYLKEANSALVLHISHLTYISAFLVAYFVPRLMR